MEQKAGGYTVLAQPLAGDVGGMRFLGSGWICGKKHEGCDCGSLSAIRGEYYPLAGDS